MTILLLLALLGGPESAEDGRRVDFSLALIPRVSTVRGDLEKAVGLHYQDVWRKGLGLTLEGDALVPLDRDWKWGGYLAGGVDVFSGSSITDDAGDTLDADQLLTSHLMVGVKLEYSQTEGLFADARLGLGAVFYSRATGTITALGGSQDVDLIDASTVFTAEAGLHAGYSSRQIYFALGVAVRTQGKPSESSDLAPLDGMKRMLVASIELEFGFRF